MLYYTYKAKEINLWENHITFTEEETSNILKELGEGTLVCRIDGLTWYEIEQTENYKNSLKQYKVKLHTTYAGHGETYIHTLLYVETLNFLKVFNNGIELIKL